MRDFISKVILSGFTLVILSVVTYAEDSFDAGPDDGGSNDTNTTGGNIISMPVPKYAIIDISKLSEALSSSSATNSTIISVSNNGNVLGSYESTMDGQIHYYRIIGSSYTELNASPVSINKDGIAVGNTADEDGVPHGCYWLPQSSSCSNLPSDSSSTAVKIYDDGKIIGSAEHEIGGYSNKFHVVRNPGNPRQHTDDYNYEAPYKQTHPALWSTFSVNPTFFPVYSDPGNIDSRIVCSITLFLEDLRTNVDIDVTMKNADGADDWGYLVALDGQGVGYGNGSNYYNGDESTECFPSWYLLGQWPDEVCTPMDLPEDNYSWNMTEILPRMLKWGTQTGKPTEKANFLVIDANAEGIVLGQKPFTESYLVMDGDQQIPLELTKANNIASVVNTNIASTTSSSLITRISGYYKSATQSSTLTEDYLAVTIEKDPDTGAYAQHLLQNDVLTDWTLTKTDFVTDSGLIAVEARRNSESTVILLVPFEVNVDADNTTSKDYPDQSKGDGGSAEKTAQHSDDDEKYPGVRVYANLFDVDKNGVPGFADGIDLYSNGHANACWKFEPMVIKVASLENFTNAKFIFKYSASDPTQMTYDGRDYKIPEGKVLRIWKKDGDEIRKPQSAHQSGDFIKADQEYSAQDLGWEQGDTEIRLYIEVVQPSVDQSFPVNVEFYPLGKDHPESIGKEKFKVRPYCIYPGNPGA